MTAVSYDNLHTRALQVMNETAGFANSEVRVGSLLRDMVESGPIGGSMPSGLSTTATGTANSIALQAALTAASASRSRIVVQPGTYSLRNEVSLPDGSFVDLEIMAGAVLDFRALIDLPSREACITIGTDSAGMVALPALAANALVNTQTVVFASAPALSIGDVFILCDEGLMSFNPNLFDNRFYYHRGEYLRVRSISGSTVVVDTPLHDSYLTTDDIDLFKVTTNSVQIHGGGQIICPGLNLGSGGSGSDVGLMLWNCYQSRVSDIRVSNARYCDINLWRSFESKLVNVTVTTQDINGNGSAGCLMISNFDCWAMGGSYEASKHGLSLTGGAIAHGVPNRYSGAEGATLRGELTAADMHGHCDRCFWLDCTIIGGASLGGSNGKISGGSVRSAADSFAVGSLKGMCLRLREVRGGSHTFEDVECFVDHLSQQAGGDNPLSFDTYEAIVAGTIVVKNITVRSTVFNAKLGYIACPTDPAAPAGGNPARLTPAAIGFLVDGLFVEPVAGSKLPALVIQGTATTLFRDVTIARTTGISPQCSTFVRAPRLTYERVDASRSETHGMVATLSPIVGVTQFIDIVNCVAEYNDDTGIFVSGSAAANDVYATVKGCRSIGNGQDAAAAGASKSSLRGETIKSLELTGNTWGDTQSVQTQAVLYSVTTTTTLLGSGNKGIGATLLRSVSATNDFEEVVFVGNASPNGAVTSPVAGRFVRRDGGAVTTQYFKETGADTNTGWVGK